MQTTLNKLLNNSDLIEQMRNDWRKKLHRKIEGPYMNRANVKAPIQKYIVE